MNPRVQVIIMSYNRIDWLEQCIKSFLAQTYSDFELIVLDNASDQDIQGMVAGFDDPRISFIRNEVNIGGPGNLKKACDIACGDYLVIFHDDDCAHPRMLEWQMRAVREVPDAVMALTGCTMVSDQATMMKFDPTAPFGYELHEDHYKLFEASLHGHLIGFGGTLYRTGAIKECRGLLDDVLERFSLCCDRAWLLTLAQRGRSIFLDSPMYKVRCHDKQDSQRLLEQYHYSLQLLRYELDLFGPRMDDATRAEFETGAVGYLISAGLWHLRNKPAHIPRLCVNTARSRLMPVSRFAGISAGLAVRRIINRTRRRLGITREREG